MPVILNVALIEAFIDGFVVLSRCVLISVKTQFSDQVKIKGTSQLIKGMFKIFQKLLRCFNGTTISRIFVIFVFLCSVFAPFS